MVCSEGCCPSGGVTDWAAEGTCDSVREETLGAAAPTDASTLKRVGHNNMKGMTGVREGKKFETSKD